MPHSVLSACLRDLQRAVPIYIDGPRRGLCEATVVVENDAEGNGPHPDEYFISRHFTTVITRESAPYDRERVAARAAALLHLDPSA